MKIEIEVPPRLYWLADFYRKMAEVRGMAGSSATVEDEYAIALEQYAIQCIQRNPRLALEIPDSPLDTPPDFGHNQTDN